MCVCIHGGALVIAGDSPCPSLYRLHVLASPQPATNACVLLSVMSRPAGHDPLTVNQSRCQMKGRAWCYIMEVRAITSELKSLRKFIKCFNVAKFA